MGLIDTIPCGQTYSVRKFRPAEVVRVACDMGCLCNHCLLTLREVLQAQAFPKPLPRLHDNKYLAWIRTLPCVLQGVPDAGACQRWYGKTEANHTGTRALSRIADDDTALPMCKGHHAMWTDYKGYFAGITIEARHAWAVDRVEIYRIRYISPPSVRDNGRFVP